jgi:hypothetical protein
VEEHAAHHPRHCCDSLQHHCAAAIPPLHPICTVRTRLRK